jgi:hypothetical protein
LKIEPAITAEEWIDILRDEVPDPGLAPGGQMPPFPPDVPYEFYGEPHRVASICLYGQPFGFTREDVRACRRELNAYVEDRDEMLRSLADRIEALLPPEK